MNKQQELKERLYQLAVRIVKLVRLLPRETASYEIGSQLIKSGTSIAANYEEATSGFSKEDFIYKLSVSFKESKETQLWLRLLRDSGLCRFEKLGELIKECAEVANILARSLKTSRANLEASKALGKR